MSEKILHDVQEEQDIITASEDELSTTSFVIEEEDIKADNTNSFVDYVKSSIDLVPEYVEDNRNSIRRAIAYYENLQDEIHATVANDADDVNFSLTDMSQLDQLDQSIDRKLAKLKDVLGVRSIQVKVKQTKHASGKAADFVYYVPPFTMAIARICINAKVANGRNLEETYQKLRDKYSMNEREHLEVLQVLHDMGYPIRSSFMNDEDMIPQYSG